jgi:hypothetical protein
LNFIISAIPERNFLYQTRGIQGAGIEFGPRLKNAFSYARIVIARSIAEFRDWNLALPELVLHFRKDHVILRIACSSVAQSAERVAVNPMQLPRVIVVEKSGEFREAFPPPGAEKGNPEPSPFRAVSERGRCRD